MKLTQKQKNDLETIVYFIPDIWKSIKIKDSDIKKFFEYSDKGLHKWEVEKISTQGRKDGFGALIEGKRWRTIHINMFQEGVLDGSMPYYVLLGGNTGTRKYYRFWNFLYLITRGYIDYRFIHNPMPRSVVNYLKKTMFNGISAENIENAYKNISY